MRTFTTLFLALALFVPAVRAAATDLKVTDSRGTEVTVTTASIDYGGFLGSDTVEDGIRIQQGDGTVMLKWADVESMRVSKRDESVKPVRIEVEISCAAASARARRCFAWAR